MPVPEDDAFYIFRHYVQIKATEVLPIQQPLSTPATTNKLTFETVQLKSLTRSHSNPDKLRHRLLFALALVAPSPPYT